MIRPPGKEWRCSAFRPFGLSQPALYTAKCKPRAGYGAHDTVPGTPDLRALVLEHVLHGLRPHGLLWYWS